MMSSINKSRDHFILACFVVDKVNPEWGFKGHGWSKMCCTGTPGFCCLAEEAVQLRRHILIVGWPRMFATAGLPNWEKRLTTRNVDESAKHMHNATEACP